MLNLKSREFRQFARALGGWGKGKKTMLAATREGGAEGEVQWGNSAPPERLGFIRVLLVVSSHFFQIWWT